MRRTAAALSAAGAALLLVAGGAAAESAGGASAESPGGASAESPGGASAESPGGASAESPGGASAESPGGGVGSTASVPSFEAARDRLRVQIRALDDSLAPGAVWRQDLLDTRTVLVRRRGDGDEVVDVTAVEAAAWQRTPEELFRLGLANLERREPPKLRQTPKLQRGVQVSLLYGEHSFAAAYALSVEHYPTCMGNRGALVAIPSRHATLCYPIESSRAFHGYLALVSMAAQVQEDGQDPIVPHVYWFHDGIFEAQPVRIEGTRVEPERTEAFRKLMKELPRDLHDSRPRRW